MAKKPTKHTALGDMGFRLVDSGFNGSSDRVGTAMTHHYVMIRNNGIGNGSISRPVAHHVFVDEYGKNPGKYNASYHVVQDGKSYSNGDFDILHKHEENVRGGVKDPIAEIMNHHHGVVGALKREQTPPLVPIDEGNVQRLLPGTHHLTEGWGPDDPEMKSKRSIVPGPGRQMTYLNAVLKKRADAFDDIISGAGSAGPCWSCGKATYNRLEGKSLQSDSSVPVNASEQTGGEMHGPDINLCGDCSGDYDNHHMAVTHGSRGPGRVWHWKDQGVPGCPECEAHLMDQADEDLRP